MTVRFQVEELDAAFRPQEVVFRGLAAVAADMMPARIEMAGIDLPSAGSLPV
jgi:hypothetical protein